MNIPNIKREVIEQFKEKLGLSEFKYYKSYQAFYRKKLGVVDVIHFRFLDHADSVEVEIEVGVRHNKVFNFSVQEFPTRFRKTSDGTSIGHRIEIIKSIYDKQINLGLNSRHPWIISDPSQVDMFVNEWVDLIKFYGIRFFDEFYELEALYNAYRDINNSFYSILDTPFKKFFFPIVDLILDKGSINEYTQSMYKELLDEHSRLGDLYYVLKQYHNFIILLINKGYLVDNLIYHKIDFEGK